MKYIHLIPVTWFRFIFFMSRAKGKGYFRYFFPYIPYAIFRSTKKLKATC